MWEISKNQYFSLNNFVETVRLLITEPLYEKRLNFIFDVKNAKKIFQKLRSKIQFKSFLLAKLNDETNTGHAIAARLLKNKNCS